MVRGRKEARARIEEECEDPKVAGRVGPSIVSLYVNVSTGGDRPGLSSMIVTSQSETVNYVRSPGPSTMYLPPC